MKKYSILLGAMLSLIFFSNTVQAEVQSPIYTDGIGRSHFLGKGGYSTMRQINMQGMEASAVNDAVNVHSGTKKVVEQEKEALEQKANETTQTVETNIVDVLKEKPTVPVSSHKTTFTSEKRKMDASAPFGYGMTNINSGVNESKTIYTDEIGRLHFFGRANQIKE